MLFFPILNAQSAATCESGRVPSHKSVYFGISKLILYFSYCFHVPFTVLSTVYFHIPSAVLFTVYFHTLISVFCFFVIDCTRKQTLLIRQFNFVYLKDLPSICQSNVQGLTAENR